MYMASYHLHFLVQSLNLVECVTRTFWASILLYNAFPDLCELKAGGPEQPNKRKEQVQEL